MKPLQLLILLIILTILAAAAIAFYVSSVTSHNMPSIEQLENPKQNLATRIYSSDDELLDHYFIERRVPLSFKDIPQDFINALIATEDRKFWKHWGVHTSRVFNSFIKNAMAGYSKEGASTITMQLARNLYLTFDVSFERKIREAVTALQIEKTYTKEEIIELYANTVNFGRGAYGLYVASKVYFDKEPLELTAAQCAFLVGLLKKPEYYSRKENYDDAIKRRNLVLRLMNEENYITGANYSRALEEPLEFATYSQRATQIVGGHVRLGIAPHFVEMLRQNLSRDNRLREYDLYRDGLVIFTTIDSRIQKHLNVALESYMPEIQKTFLDNWSWNKNKELLTSLINKAIRGRANYKAADASKKEAIAKELRLDRKFIDSVKNAATTVQIGAVLLDPSTGAILAMAGASPKFMRENPDAKYSLNHAVQIKRQPGSAFKPFVYASAFMKGLTPNSRIPCGPFSYTLATGEVWSPRGSNCNDGETTVTLTSGMARSINSVAARLITQATSPADVVALAQRMGIKSNLVAVPALSLGGGGEVNPLELTSAFGTFAFNGMQIEPYIYSRITNNKGDILAEKRKSKSVLDVFDKEIAQQMTFILQAVINQGTASRVRQFLKDVDAAGKTGTTNKSTDAWFVGYTPQLVLGIWLGFDEQQVTFDCLGSVGYGGRTAAPLWGRIMAEIYADPLLPYKQKKFIFNPVDSTDNGASQWIPYNLTSTQKQAVEIEQRDVPPIGPNPVPSSEQDGANNSTPILPPLPKRNN